MNSFGHSFILTTFGESHGTAVGGVVDGCPAGITLDFEAIAHALRRRRDGDCHDNKQTTSRKESDNIEWLSGLLDGVTLGTPIAFVIHNHDANPADYEALRPLCRPGHADYTYEARYGLRDWRGGGRASGRETAARVVGGAIALQVLKSSWPDMSLRATADSQHCVACHIDGIPAGIGNPLFDKLNARLAYAMMSIPSAIGFEMGLGFAGATLDAQDWRDEWQIDASTATNHCGGVQGGISNGMPITFRVAFHAPTTTPGKTTTCFNPATHTLHDIIPTGRHDSDHISRLPAIVEAMACLVLADMQKCK